VVASDTKPALQGKYASLLGEPAPGLVTRPVLAQVVMRAVRTCAAVAAGFAVQYFAAKPATWGQAIDVPDMVRVPLSLALGDHDSLLDEKSVAQIKELMEKKSSPSEVRVYEDQVHGFALRSDWSSEKDKKAMDESERQGIEWFNKYLS